MVQTNQQIKQKDKSKSNQRLKLKNQVIAKTANPNQIQIKSKNFWKTIA